MALGSLKMQIAWQTGSLGRPVPSFKHEYCAGTFRKGIRQHFRCVRRGCATRISAVTSISRIRARAKFFFDGEKKFFVKGVTYGPFEPKEEGIHLPPPEKVREDLKLMQALGANLLRIYHPPPTWFLNLCAEAGIRVMVTIPWAEHVQFLKDTAVRKEIVRTIRDAVRSCGGHPAIFGFLVGNEIPTTMVRWLGVKEVTEFVEHLVEVGRKEDPTALFSYASYPPTEYLLPQNVDFYTFNVYLHNQGDFEKYLLRLQNLAEDRPLMLGEFGMDTIRHPESEQAEMLGWHVESVVRCGLAGTVIFSWTDEWFTGGSDITDWAFGLVKRDREPKEAFHRLKTLWYGNDTPTEKVALPSFPKVSVVVCSYNGAKTLGDCLDSLDLVRYPDFEIVLVDDGSNDGTQEVVAAYLKKREARREGGGVTLPGFVSIVQKNMGLSYARNAGAHASTGEVIAYTDSDCMADPEWLYYLVGTLLSGSYAGVGGPNISPPAVNWVQAAVAAAPGGPSHVLLTDVVAEHIPGCNMAFHRWAFDMVGGFDPEYRKAGDDVDFCWRLQTAGQVIAFSASAIVWHYRRFTLKAFRKQQEGYGEAESMLRFKHLVFFGPTGTAKWKGMIYGAPRFTWLVNRPVVYHGVFGQGLFQSIYPTQQSDIAAYLSSLEWLGLTLLIGLISIPFDDLRIVPYLMFGGTFLVALSYMVRARLEGRFDTVPARLLVMVLALTQPWVRGWSRYFTWLKFKQTPKSVISSAPELDAPKRGRFSALSSRRYWNEEGAGREALLTEIFQALETEGWSYSSDTGWKTWDAQIYGNFWWIVKLQTVTEYHGGPKCLTRVKMHFKAVATTVLINALLLLFLGWREIFTDSDNTVFHVIYFGFLLFLGWRAFRLKVRVAALVDACAVRCGLNRVFGRGKK